MTLPKPLTALLATACVLLGTVLPCRAQSADSNGQPASRPATPLLSADEMTSTFFRPEHVNVSKLAQLADVLHGRQISIEEKGGALASPVPNILTIGDSLLIYEDAASAQRILEWCRQVDGALRDDRGGEQQQDESPEIVVAEWRPAYIGLLTGYQALRPFLRKVRINRDHHKLSDNDNVSAVEEQGTLVLRDTREQLDAMLALLQRIDRPEPQLLLTAMVITGEHGTAGEGAGAVPAELAENLGRLVPYSSFRVESLGLVRSSARSDSLEIQMGASHSLRLLPEAYDEASGTLTAHCSFRSESGLEFETLTTIGTGQFTVLGASGEQPLFCVLRIEGID